MWVKHLQCVSSLPLKNFLVLSDCCKCNMFFCSSFSASYRWNALKSSSYLLFYEYVNKWLHDFTSQVYDTIFDVIIILLDHSMFSLFISPPNRHYVYMSQDGNGDETHRVLPSQTHPHEKIVNPSPSPSPCAGLVFRPSPKPIGFSKPTGNPWGNRHI